MDHAEDAVTYTLNPLPKQLGQKHGAKFRPVEVRQNARGGYLAALKTDLSDTATPKLAEAVAAWANYVKDETLCVDLAAGELPGAASAEDAFDGETVKVMLAEASGRSIERPAEVNKNWEML